MWPKGVATALIVCLGGACAQHELARVDPNQAAETVEDVPGSRNRDLDILFVLDNSGSMGEEQESLAANFGRFADVLAGLEGGLPNIHLGVISTDVGAGPYGIAGCVAAGDSGRLQNTPRGACTPPSGTFIKDIALPDGTRTRNYTGELGDAFACIARLGTDGCGFEMPLEAMRRALDGSNPGNHLFLRPDAFLLVVFISDEDDCSAADRTLFNPADASLGPLTSFRCFEHGVSCAEPILRTPGSYSACGPHDSSPYLYDVEAYADFLKSQKSDPNMVLVAAIVGDPAPVQVQLDNQGRPELVPSCSSQAGVAAPAIRLAHFLAQFPNRSTLTTICNEDLSEALELVAQYILPFLAPCIDGQIDLDADELGVQYRCAVYDVRKPGTPTQEETILPHCRSVPPAPDEPLPCWHLEHRPDSCPDTATQLSLVVERGGASVPPDTRTVARCQLR